MKFEFVAKTQLLYYEGGVSSLAEKFLKIHFSKRISLETYIIWIFINFLLKLGV